MHRLLFIWVKWQWVHRLLGHTFTDRDTPNGRIRVCSCGIEWTVTTNPLGAATRRGAQE